MKGLTDLLGVRQKPPGSHRQFSLAITGLGHDLGDDGRFLGPS